MSKLEELKAKAVQIRSSRSHWASCQDGSYERALAESGYYRLLKEIVDLKKELLNGEIQ